MELGDALETMAAAIHETWRSLSHANGWAMQPRLNRPYAELDEIDKEDNRAAARRMPRVLALAVLGLTGDDPNGPAPVSLEETAAVLERHIDRLAEAEHDGWMDQRLRNGWRYGPVRNDAARLHPSIRPYAELSPDEQEKDKNNVRHYPEFVSRGHARVVRLR
jgi:hypothetical protein